MSDSHDLLGLAPGATPAEIKSAYHRKLKEFPAHSHPQEFKAIRAAYDTLRKSPQGLDDFFAPKPITADLDKALVTQLEQRVRGSVDVTLEDLILLTF
ncbi:DnaJ domain-containing protein [Nodosilinea sp. P-1105]|uniref:J domain-containing protein n=1 Tax=Nodosilinea sp. P-1105 TaxID=2546229 RepID=UPI00146A29E0|nr:DnaJ domain-containing protein [Nodosilinea sp. P-1105]NMF83440.1 molecular chaperone DnaJ [Nodosilinea sp. P-1105]